MAGTEGAIDADRTASSPAPDPALARLRRRGVGRQTDGRWFVADPEAVATVLNSQAAVVTTSERPRGAVDRLRATMARFSDGNAHARRRAIAVAAITGLDTDRVRSLGRELTAAALEGRTEIALGDLAGRVPVQALAAEMGWTGPRIDEAVGLLCARLAPRLDAPERPDDATVLAGLRDVVGELDERRVNELGVLFQARDATAALVAVAATRLLDGHGRDEVTEADVLAVDRAEPVLHTTTRRTVAALALGDVTIPAGSTIVVALGAATRGTTGATASFGAGPHACPGRHLAVAVAAGMLTALARRGAWLPDPTGYEARPNLRVPVLASAMLPTAGPTTGGGLR